MSVMRHLSWTKLSKGYSVSSKVVEVCDIKQRWLLISSEQAYKREEKTFKRKHLKHGNILYKELWHLSKKTFDCENDAKKATKPIIKRLKHYQLDYEVKPLYQHTKPGRPSINDTPSVKGYVITFSLFSNLKMIEETKKKLGRFILATNQLDENILPMEDVLLQYKEQSKVESGFKFIKDNSFELDSFYLKTPERIGALMMIMTLCLMVYNFAQYNIRKCLKDNKEVLPNQQGKPVQNPTMKWIAELMQMIAVVTINTGQQSQRIVTNLKQVHIVYFGSSALTIYGLPNDLKQVNIDYSEYRNLAQWCKQ